MKEEVLEQEKQIGELEDQTKKSDEELKQAFKTGLEERKRKVLFNNKLWSNSFSKQYCQS